MPLAAPARPRKMFPPPITMQIWLPPSAASFTSLAMRSTVPTSMPKLLSPINASPETLSSTRAYRGVVSICGLLSARARHLGDFVGEVAFHFFDAFAHLEADKAFDHDGRAQFLGGFLKHF